MLCVIVTIIPFMEQTDNCIIFLPSPHFSFQFNFLSLISATNGGLKGIRFISILPPSTHI